MKRVIVFLFGLSGLCGSVVAAEGGEIHFRGAIIEAPCAVQHDETSLSMLCWRDHELQPRSIAWRQLDRGDNTLWQAQIKTETLSQANVKRVTITYP